MIKGSKVELVPAMLSDRGFMILHSGKPVGFISYSSFHLKPGLKSPTTRQATICWTNICPFTEPEIMARAEMYC